MAKDKFKTAEQMGEEQREISVSEFFEKNRHLLGFDKPAKALLMVVKEAVDNSIDAAEESGILPEISVKIKQMANDRFRITVQDNGPGIVKAQIPRIFAKLLYGSKFGKNRQSRGAQGIGISASVLYSQLTTGKATTIRSRVKGKSVQEFNLRIDTIKNEPQIIESKIYDKTFSEHGTFIQMEIEGVYRKGKRSVDEYIKETALANPHAKLTLVTPDKNRVVYKRIVSKQPKLSKAIKPHPHGVELGVFERMLKLSKARSCSSFLTNDFCRVGAGTAKQICKMSKIKPSTPTHKIDHQMIERFWRTVQKTKIMKPPLDCLSPIGENVLEEAIRKDVKAEFVAAITRPPNVYRGNPFAIEVAIGYGGELEKNKTAEIIRLSNRVPLLYQASSCAITKALKKISWTRYKVENKNKIPYGPYIILIHIHSTWIPYTSESKEAIDAYPVILKEIHLALQDCLRKLARFLASQRRIKLEKQRQSLFEKYIPEIADALSRVAEVKKESIQKGLEKILNKNKKDNGGIVVEEKPTEKIKKKTPKSLKDFSKKK